MSRSKTPPPPVFQVVPDTDEDTRCIVACPPVEYEPGRFTNIVALHLVPTVAERVCHLLNTHGLKDSETSPAAPRLPQDPQAFSIQMAPEVAQVLATALDYLRPAEYRKEASVQDQPAGFVSLASSWRLGWRDWENNHGASDCLADDCCDALDKGAHICGLDGDPMDRERAGNLTKEQAIQVLEAALHYCRALAHERQGRVLRPEAGVWVWQSEEGKS